MIDFEDLAAAFYSYIGAKTNLETTLNNYEGCEFSYQHGHLYDYLEDAKNELELKLDDYIDSRILHLLNKSN